MESNRKHYFARIPTIALFLLFAIQPFLGIVLFILKHIDRDAEKKEQAAARAQAEYAADFRPSGAGAGQAVGPAAAHDLPTEEQKRAKKRQNTVAWLCSVFGLLFLVAGLGSMLNFFDAPAVGTLFSALGQLIGGGGALCAGAWMDRARKLERRLDKVVGSRDNIPLDELFAAAGIAPDRGRRVLENAIDHGYFGADAYIDNRTDTLIVRGPAPQPPAPEHQPAPEDAEGRYASLLRQLRAANDAISDPALSAKIDRLEQVSARIFALAQQDPGREAQLKKFMDYYLPTALKLLNTYATLDKQGVEGQNITEAKQSIERSMDLLVTAFENQLDKLFQADALDVSADIAALEGMLNLDGLAGSDFAAGK